jgi:hypothetical protein
METMTSSPEDGLTFEKVWQMFQTMSKETDRIIKETALQMKETDRILKETDQILKETDQIVKETAQSQKETDRIVKETARSQKETDLQIKRMSERVDRVTTNVGGLNRDMGEIIETLIAAKLWEKFDAYSYDFKRAYRRMELFDERNRKLTDIDILLSNGEYVMAVEVKTELDGQDQVKHHLRRMELIQKYPPAECRGKKLLGAMAGAAVNEEVRDYAHELGLFVLELTGDFVRLAETPPGFKPCEYQVQGVLHPCEQFCPWASVCGFLHKIGA